MLLKFNEHGLLDDSEIYKKFKNEDKFGLQGAKKEIPHCDNLPRATISDNVHGLCPYSFGRFSIRN